MQQFAAQLIIDDLRKIDSEANVFEETGNGRNDQPVLIDSRSYEVPENVAVEKERESHRSAETRPISFQIRLEFPPEVSFLLGGGAVHEGAQ